MLNLNRLFIFVLVAVIPAVSLRAQDTTQVKTDSTVQKKPSANIQSGEIEIEEITIEAVIEKPRVSILPKRVDPELGEMEFVDRSFENELKKGPSEPLLDAKKAREPYKIERQEVIPKSKDK